jgi:hypothetical protein
LFDLSVCDNRRSVAGEKDLFEITRRQNDSDATLSRRLTKLRDQFLSDTPVQYAKRIIEQDDILRRLQCTQHVLRFAFTARC